MHGKELMYQVNTVCLRLNTLRPRQDGFHFATHILEWKLLYFEENFIEICSQGSNWYKKNHFQFWPFLCWDRSNVPKIKSKPWLLLPWLLLSPQYQQPWYWLLSNLNIRCTLAGNEIVDHSHVLGASPVGAAPTRSSFSNQHLASMDQAKTTTRRDEKHLSFGIWCTLY